MRALARALTTKHVEVLVIGGGNATLCAAMTARDDIAEVLAVDSADREWRGDNSKYTRNIRA